MSESYAALLRLAPARRLVYALTAACLSFGMVSLTILLLVERETGSYPAGGLAAAAFALLAGVSAPFRGRLVDRRGARPWLPLLAVGYTIFLVLLDIVAGSFDAPPAWLLIALAGAAGISAPPLFATARSVWSQVVRGSLLRRGYAVTSLISDVGLVAGPALAGLLFLITGWIAPLVCGLAALVAAVLSLPPRERGVQRVQPRPMPRLRESRALSGLLVVSVLLGIAVGLAQVAVPTVAAQWGESSLAGPLLAALAFGSVLGAIWFGGRRRRGSVIDRYLLAVFLLGVLLAPVGLARGPVALSLLLIAAGLALGPATVSLFETLDVVAPGSGAESLTWVTTAEAGGTALGSASRARWCSTSASGRHSPSRPCSSSSRSGLSSRIAGWNGVAARNSLGHGGRSTIRRKMRFQVDFLGCKVSHLDAQAVRERLLGDGHERRVRLPRSRSINSCCVTNEAVAKSRKAAARAARTHERVY